MMKWLLKPVNIGTTCDVTVYQVEFIKQILGIVGDSWNYQDIIL